MATKQSVITDAAEFKEELLSHYPSKIAKKRSKGFVLNDPDTIPEVQANVRTIPGIITQRGCTYAGCKGVVLGPTRDIVNLVHGPIGCSFYAWLTRRNQTKPETPTEENFIPYAFSTDLQDSNIVFGGDKKLAQAIQEAYDIFKPKAIGVFSTCPVGLIGDDIHKTAALKKKELGINIFAFSCEGYRGVSQSAGHHIANNGLFTHVVGLENEKIEGKFKINLLGEYNIGGDAFVLEDLFERCGITLIASFSGNTTMKKFESSHQADLNTVMCHRSINYIADMMEVKYGIPWIKVSFIGAEASAKSLRKIAQYFGDKDLTAQVEKVIAEEMAKVDAALAPIKPKTTGKTAMMFVGGSRAHHYQDLFKELGMTVLAAGYEFAHRDDYEGREVIPSIKIDADSRNIEELDIEKDEKLFRPRKTDAELAKLAADGFRFKDYDGMMPEMDKNAMIIDDVNHLETELLIERYHPDVFCAGIKEKYVIHKMGLPMKQLHNYDMGGPYAGFAGAINFYKDLEQIVCCTAWKLVKAPWEKQPELVGSVASEA